MSHHGGHHKPKTAQIRSERRARAEQVSRESGYSKLTTREKLDRVLRFIAIAGNGEAGKERARLEDTLIKDAQPKAVAASAVPKAEGVAPKAGNGSEDVESPHNRRGRKTNRQ